MRGNRLFKSVDRYVGSALLRTLGLIRRRRKLPTNTKRIALMRAAAIGDALLLRGAVIDLQAAFPGAEIFFIHGETNQAVAPLFRDKATVVGIKLSRPWESIFVLRKLRLDVLVDFSPWPRIDALLTAFSKAKFTAGFQTSGQGRHYCYDATVPHSGEMHELQNYRRLIGVLGINSESPATFSVTPGAYAGPPPVIFHPWPGGYRSELREWPEDRWLTLGQYLQARSIPVYVTIAPGDEARAADLVKKLRGRGIEAEPLAPALDLEGLAERLSGAAAVVSVNTGIMHLASLLGAPTVALNGPTSTLRWGPTGPRSVSVEPRCERCGFLNLGSEYDGQREDCMEHIHVDDVIAALEKLIPKFR